MKLSNALAITGDIRASFLTAIMPTLWAIYATPSLILHPSKFSRIFMAHVWLLFADGIDGNQSELKKTMITPNTHGVVLDIGAGHGHTSKYLDRSKVTKYVALEPNTLMHDAIRKSASAAGFTEADGSLLILPYGAEQISLIASALGDYNSVDTLVSILTLCSVPAPVVTIHGLVERLLKPGGHFLFVEHVRSPRADVAWWQAFWTPVWRHVMDGCSLARPTHQWIDEIDVWQVKELWTPEDQEEEHLFWRQAGIFVKREK